MITAVTPSWATAAPSGSSNSVTLTVMGSGFSAHSNLHCEIGDNPTAMATVTADNMLTCTVLLSQSVTQLSESGNYIRVFSDDGTYSNLLSFFYESPPVITSVTVTDPTRGFKRLSIIGSNFKTVGVWCDFGSSMTRPIHRGSLLSCPIPQGLTAGTVRIFQDGQKSNAVNWSV
jgi:hypothetical protein